MSRKVYVTVTAKFDQQGALTPLNIRWEDNTLYEIDRVLAVERAASLKVGGVGVRYTIRIGETVTYLWYEEPAWFVEGK